MSRIARPSQTLIIHEKADFHDTKVGLYNSPGVVDASINMVFCDGHAKFIKLSTTRWMKWGNSYWGVPGYDPNWVPYGPGQWGPDPALGWDVD